MAPRTKRTRSHSWARVLVGLHIQATLLREVIQPGVIRLRKSRRRELDTGEGQRRWVIEDSNLGD